MKRKNINILDECVETIAVKFWDPIPWVIKRSLYNTQYYDNLRYLCSEHLYEN